MLSIQVLKALAFASVAIASPVLTNVNYGVVENQPFNISWSGSNGPLSIVLKNGSPSNLQTVSTIASGITGSSYIWTPTNLPTDTYSLMISDDGQQDANYSPQFQLAGAPAVVPPAAPSTSSTSSTESSTESSTSTESSSSSASMTIMTNTDAGATATGTGMPASSTNGTDSPFPSSSSSETGKASSTSSKSTATGSKTSESGKPMETGDNKNAASSLANPVGLVLFALGALTFFN